jgi:hypothetical protein
MRELIPESIYRRLKTLAPFRRGRTNARESKPVRPVPEHLIEPIRPFVSNQVWTMIQLTAERPSAGRRPLPDGGGPEGP